MLTPAFSSSPDSIEDHEFEQHLQEAIIAIKNGNRALGKRLLEQAALINNTDARIWIWFSATTDDPQEQRGYLENAVAVDPSNATAKRGLLILTGQVDKARLMTEGEAYVPQKTSATDEAIIKTYTCPNCGATIAFDVNEIKLVCQFCGFTRKIDEHVLAESTAQVLDQVLPTTRAHRWAENRTRLTCEQCGAVILLPPGQTADSCPYCASNRFVTSASLIEIVDPQVIGLFKVDPEKAASGIKTWLGKGLLSPDDLSLQHAGLHLYPAYYPFWLFSGTLEIPWFCDINVGSGKTAQWEAQSGSQFEMFDDVLIPGLRKMPLQELSSLEPFTLADLVEFSPDYLAGWVALTYDHPLADASLRARETIIKKAQRIMPDTVEPSQSKRNFSIGAGKWSGLTYKLTLLPIYVGNYQFQGKSYRLFVNGQTGKVAGKKPTDTLKLVMYSIVGIVLLIIVMALLSLFGKLLFG